MEGRAVVVGSGPNGLVAACVLARAGLDVEVREAAAEPGGALRSTRPFGPGAVVDGGAAVLPLAVASPALRALPLERHGLRWAHPQVPLAHPLEGRPAALLTRDLASTADGLGRDGGAWRALHGPAVRGWEPLLDGVLGPLLRLPEHPLTLASFGVRGAWPATLLARAAFRDEPARALLAGSAAHAVLPLSSPLTAAFGVLLGAAAATTGWPVARGGSAALARALVAVLEADGGRVSTSAPVHDLAELRGPDGRPPDLVLLDLTPRQVLAVAEARLPDRYADRLRRFRYGVGASKVDYLLDGPVPWSDPRVAGAGTVHVGGRLDEVAGAEADVHAGRLPDRPFLLVAQQGAADPTRAPAGQQVLWAYTHVPPGCDRPVEDQVTAQLERFAPGFRDRVLARHATHPSDLERWDANLVGGDVGGGSLSGLQQLRRPVLSPNPWATPVPGLLLCSASTPPGGGVHGMCGWHAAHAGLRQLAARRR